MAAVAPSYGGPSWEQMDSEQRRMARDIGGAVAAAVLETLADAAESARWPMSMYKLRGLAAEVKEERP